MKPPRIELTGVTSLLVEGNLSMTFTSMAVEPSVFELKLICKIFYCKLYFSYVLIC